MRLYETTGRAPLSVFRIDTAERTFPLAGGRRKSILICDSEPVAVDGMKWLIEGTEDLEVAGSATSLDQVYRFLLPGYLRDQNDSRSIDDATGASAAEGPIEMPPTAILADAVIIDKQFGMSDVVALIHAMNSLNVGVPIVVWGSTLTEAEALRVLRAGARGVLRRTAGTDALLRCLREVAWGSTWVEDGLFTAPEDLFATGKPRLTPREREVVNLVERGLRNNDIARSLGITTGTVKIHMKHIFEKTGVRGRHGLALNGLREKELPLSPQAERRERDLLAIPA